MNSKERIQSTLNHTEPDKVAVDFGGTVTTGIHVELVEKLRNYFGLEKKPVKVVEPFQMLGEIDHELLNLLGGDIIGFNGPNNMFGISQNNWKELKTFWGQTVLMPDLIGQDYNDNGDLLVYPEGDTSVAPSSIMPKSGYFFDAIPRGNPVIDEATLKVEDNLEEFKEISESDLTYWKNLIEGFDSTDKSLAANFGGTALGDIALVPAVSLKNPKGIRLKLRSYTQ